MSTLDIRNMMARPPVPGEVWVFDALEGHAFYDIFMALSVTGLISKENPTLKSYLRTLKMINDSYKLAKSDLELPNSTEATSTKEDFGFFSGLVPFFKIFVENEYAKTEKIKELQTEFYSEHHECPCGNSDCEREDELPCGHSAKEHLTILAGWYKREIIETEKFAATRIAVEKVPYEERYIGKPIIVRSDMERVIYEGVEDKLNRGAYSEELTEELVEKMLLVFPELSRQEAEEQIKSNRENFARQMREDAIKESEKEYRVIDI